MSSMLSEDNYESMTLDEWVSSHPSEEELRSVFFNLDRALKYIHEHGYCIDVFYPSMINVLNNDDNYIQYKKLVELSSDFSIRKEMIREDIFNSSLIQIGIYSNTLKYLKPEFLKENFDEFVKFLPAEDVPYYRGVIERGASVYFSEYALEKRARDLESLEKQLGGEDSSKQLLKEKNDTTNNVVNDVIYRQINGVEDKAFISFLLIPTIILGLLVLFGLLYLLA